MIDRRDLIGTALGAGLLAATAATAEGWGDPPTPAIGDPDAPAWPPAEHFAIWPKAPPGARDRLPERDWTLNGPKGARELWIRGVPTPELHVFRPARPDGSALLVLPGGGYEFLSVQNEGINIAQRFSAAGTTLFVLTYRLPAEGWDNAQVVPLQDAQRAMRLIRSRELDFRIDPARLGIVGFSAGGHLAASLATAFAEPVYAPVDAADALSARPAFAGLIYPVTSLEPRIGHAGSRNNLLGSSPTPERIASRSPLLHVGPGTPPCFLVHAVDDDTVPVANSLEWIQACRKAEVKVEAHIFETGGHGFGLHLPPDLPGSMWPLLLAMWMKKHGG
ncbi:MAG: alpha/beta hydrolase [Alphaproteobacteria bacterium]|nr:alpha/beta hydrolase [Alphaproteobacteria bacterium]